MASKALTGSDTEAGSGSRRASMFPLVGPSTSSERMPLKTTSPRLLITGELTLTSLFPSMMSPVAATKLSSVKTPSLSDFGQRPCSRFRLMESRGIMKLAKKVSTLIVGIQMR